MNTDAGVKAVEAPTDQVFTEAPVCQTCHFSSTSSSGHKHRNESVYCQTIKVILLSSPPNKSYVYIRS